MFQEIRSHAEYQTFVEQQLKLHYAGSSILCLVPKDWYLIKKFWITDLSRTADLLKGQYSDRGSKAKDPANLMRSYLLMLSTKQTSVTNWVDDLRRIPLYAIISGFQPGDTPGIGTFYDFFDRLWNLETPHISSPTRPKRKKPKKGKKGEKAPTTTPGKVARLVKRLTKYPSHPRILPVDTLQTLFKEQFVLLSAQMGLLGNVQALSIAGDGTPVRTAAYPRSKRLCSCREQGIHSCNCPRLYSQPDCDSGWDSARECYFNGYHLYMFTAADSFHDLPLYPRLHRASRHDSVSLVWSVDELIQQYPEFTWSRILLDAAHDALPIYEYLGSKQVTPLIDLNKRNMGNTTYKDDFTLSPTGIPICKKGLEMKNNGYDHTRGRRKYRCPLMKKGVVTCDTPCSDSAYGRCVYTYSKDNPRLFPPIARNSDEWKEAYKRRTTVERSNKREKIDYMLEAAKHHSTKMWTIRIYGIMMCQHMDAWFEESDLDLKPLLLTA